MRPIIESTSHTTLGNTFPLRERNVTFALAGGVQRPAPATHPAAREDVRQLVAFIHVVDIDLLVAATGVDLQGAAGGVPFVVPDELEGGLGFEDEDEEESCECLKVHFLCV